MELGTYTFGEVTHDPATGRQLNVAERMRDLLEGRTTAAAAS